VLFLCPKGENMTERQLIMANELKRKINELEEITEALNFRRTSTTYSSTGDKIKINYTKISFYLHLTDGTNYDKIDIPAYLFTAIKEALSKEKERLINEFSQL
jgi:hypothetical protein